jgi:acyl carrier protein
MDSDLEARVKAFVARERATSPGRLSPETTLYGDLGTDGADGWELIESFGEEFGVDLASFDPSKHFGPEGSGCPLALVLWLVEEVILRRDPHETSGLTPITIRDLVEAAEQKRWLL